mgnify:CR=1 FL=1
MDIEAITDLLEALTILCFGLSWPISIRKSLISRTAKGKSLFFEFFIWIGYIFGIIAKLVDDTLSYTLFFYCLNICMVGTCVVFYFINARRDRLADEAARELAAGSQRDPGGDDR